MLCCAAQCSAGAVAVLAARASPSQSGDARVRPGLWLATGPRWAGKLGWAGLLLLWSLAPLGAAARPPSQAAQLGLIPSKLPGPCNPSVPALSRSASFLPSIEHRRHEVRYRPPVNGQQRFISLLSGLDILSTPVVCYLDCSFFFFSPFSWVTPLLLIVILFSPCTIIPRVTRSGIHLHLATQKQRKKSKELQKKTKPKSEQASKRLRTVQSYDYVSTTATTSTGQ
jgi:hypothetical protein